MTAILIVMWVSFVFTGGIVSEVYETKSHSVVAQHRKELHNFKPVRVEEDIKPSGDQLGMCQDGNSLNQEN